MHRGHSHLYPFDPGSGTLPEIATPNALLSGAGGGVVTLIVAPDVAQNEWSPAAAVALARVWSESGRRVVLFDLSLTAPILHEVLGLPNAVGVGDLILREASISAVAQQAGSPTFQFVAAGPAVDDPTVITLSEDWAKFLGELGNSDANILFYVPADLPGVDALVARSASTLLLAGDPIEAEWVAESFALEDLVGLVEDGGAGLTPIAADAPDTPEEAPDTFIFPPVPSPVVDVQEPEDPMSIAPDEPKQPLPWKPALIGTLVGIGALMAWQLFYSPGTASDRSDVPVRATPVVAASPVEAVADPNSASGAQTGDVRSATGSIQAYSLALAAYESQASASEQANVMTRRRPDLLFIVAPVRVSGRVYYRLLAGPSEDSAGAERLRASLAETLRGDSGARWIVRSTPQAFLLGEFESRGEAEAHVAEMRAGAVDAYILVASGPASPLYRVYAGAYQDASEAAEMSERIETVSGEEPILQTRAGRYEP